VRRTPYSSAAPPGPAVLGQLPSVERHAGQRAEVTACPRRTIRRERCPHLTYRSLLVKPNSGTKHNASAGPRLKPVLTRLDVRAHKGYAGNMAPDPGSWVVGGQRGPRQTPACASWATARIMTGGGLWP
jgi:hypothetical protein